MADAYSILRPNLVEGNKSFGDVTNDICAPMEKSPGILWWIAICISSTMFLVGFAATAYQVSKGIGTWGLNKTVGWAFDITNFVFWIGIGHAGTLISAVLFLFRQKWRTAVNRAAEAMTLFAVACAGIFPLIHMGRPWLFFWITPYPNFRGPLWVNFRSPLVWDFFAISTYFTISAVFWYIGLIPDLATARDRAEPGIRKQLLTFFSFGWNGSYKTWNHYETMYLLLAGLATPLVFSVHSIVSMDFATSVVPGWHTTIFPPYFVAGAIFSGLAMVLTLMLVVRKVMNLEEYLTPNHINIMCKLVLSMSCIVGLAYATEFFTALYSGNPYEQFVFLNRALGPFKWAYWSMVTCNVIIPQLLWIKFFRTNLYAVFFISIVVNIGMWFERFVIIVTSLHRDFLPSSWADYFPTSIEVLTFMGTFGLFFTAFLLFCRFLPVIAIGEVKGVLSYNKHEEHHDAAPEAASPVIPASTPLPEGMNRRYLLATFESEKDILHATDASRRKGLKIVDVYSPYAVHGLEKAMGLPPSKLTWACFLFGAAGVLVALVVQFWISAINWPIDIGGRPWNSLPAFVPITFELMVLFAGLGTVFTFFLIRRMFPGKAAELPVPALTDNRFLLILEQTDASFDPQEVHGFLKQFHVSKVEEREMEN